MENKRILQHGGIRFMRAAVIKCFFAVLFLGGCGASTEIAEEVAGAENEPSFLLPELEIRPVTIVNHSSAEITVRFTVQQGRMVESKGVCVSTSPMPDQTNSCTDEGDMFDEFTSRVAGLQPETKYYARAYATSQNGTVWSNQVEFMTTEEVRLIIQTLSPDNLNKEKRTGRFRATFEGSAVSRVSRNGFVWDTFSTPDLSHNFQEAAVGSAISAEIGNLRFDVFYFVRAYAELDGEIIYGEPVPFKLEPYEIGDEGPAGGIIFFYDAEGEYDFTFLESAPIGWYGTTDDPRLRWPCDRRIMGTSELAIGMGKSNSAKIRSRCREAQSAAGVIQNLDINGYTDWFFPSRKEVKLLRENLHLKNMGGFAPEFYWSSTEEDSEMAWGIFFGSGNQRVLTKWIQERVRPIRSF
ncbi:MAG: DUF1566 domain-containing protein [Balneolales bacterium]|nr:DUF1566 domain-containing protein [Balneolales bacterium]